MCQRHVKQRLVPRCRRQWVCQVDSRTGSSFGSALQLPFLNQTQAPLYSLGAHCLYLCPFLSLKSAPSTETVELYFQPHTQSLGHRHWIEEQYWWINWQNNQLSRHNNERCLCPSYIKQYSVLKYQPKTHANQQRKLTIFRVYSTAIASQENFVELSLRPPVLVAMVWAFATSKLSENYFSLLLHWTTLNGAIRDTRKKRLLPNKSW